MSKNGQEIVQNELCEQWLRTYTKGGNIDCIDITDNKWKTVVITRWTQDYTPASDTNIVVMVQAGMR